MTSSYDVRGHRVGVTVLEVYPNVVTQIKTLEGKDGYNAVQLGIGSRKYLKKPQLGHLKKSNVDQKVRWLKEVRENGADLSLGQEIKPSDIFVVGDTVRISGTTKGKGFQGGVRRYGFAGGPKTHGQSDRHRAPGSIGATTTPGRVYKGKKMAGHMGFETMTVKNLEVVAVDRENNLILVKGAVPGHNGGLVEVEKIGHVKGHTPPEPEEIVEEVETVVEEAPVAVEENNEVEPEEQVAEEAKE